VPSGIYWRLCRQAFIGGFAVNLLPAALHLSLCHQSDKIFTDVPMARWLTFDRNTASALRKQLPREQVFEHGARNAVEYASGSNQTLVTLLPPGSSSEVAIAVFRQPAAKLGSSPKPVLVQKPAAKEQPLQAAPSAWKVVEPAPPASAPASAVPEVPKSKAPTPVPQTPASRNPEASLPFVRQKTPQVRAGGILGTRDELVFEEEPVAKVKKNWWQRFWEDED
jgi:hypothetical protein